MRKESVIGFVYRYDYNYYGILIGELPKKMSDRISKEIMQLSDVDQDFFAEVRGDKSISIDDANIDYFERDTRIDRIVDDMKKYYYDEWTDNIPTDDQIKDMIKDNPQEVIENLLKNVKDLYNSIDNN